MLHLPVGRNRNIVMDLVARDAENESSRTVPLPAAHDTKAMIVQFFEPQLEEGQIDRYLTLAGQLKPSLDAMGGCLFLERFKSLNQRNVLLSYQMWQDEGSMIAWRVDAKHHAVQEIGRQQLFADASTEYFRVFEVMRDYGMFDRKEAPQYYPPASTRG